VIAIVLVGLAVLPSVLADQRGSAEIFRDGFEKGLTSWSNVAGTGDPSLGGDLLATTVSEYPRDFGGWSEQPAGALVSIEFADLGPRAAPTGTPPRYVTDGSPTPGGATFIIDLYDAPPPAELYDGNVTGLAIDSTGTLWAATCDDPCNEEPARLLRVSSNGSQVTDLGPIIDQDGAPITGVADLAMQPGTDILFVGTDYGNCGDGDCLYTLDRTSAVATLVGEVDTSWLGGLAFTPDGTLYMVAAAGPDFDNFRNREMLVLDPATAETLSVEPVLLEQQFEITRGGKVYDLSSVSFQALGADEQGTLVACWAHGGMTLYRRERGVVKDKFGSPVTGDEQWVWKHLGDVGEHIGDLVFR
jgi:hypothetical protein